MKWILLAIIPFILSCSSPQPKPDVPRYSPDQVINIVRSAYPTGWASINGFRQETPTKVQVEYQGQGIWKATLTLPFRFHFDDFNRTKVLYFYESNGSLR